MKVTIVGGGPGGLYLAILLKKADRATDVRVIERNAPDATFGWGIVFSEETLGALRDADQETYLEITDTFVRWDRLDVRYRGRLLSSRGHSFSAIARTRLLEILQRRCRSLGVDVEFGTEVDDLAPLADGADLLVGADGVNSVVRRAHASELGTEIQPEGCRYVWFGTDLVFDAFTFIFRETEFGLFQVHAYPFDERTSTFIVECPEETWRRAGLDEMGEEESLAFCEQLLARDLRGRELLSNRSLWLSFPKVTNRVWHYGRVALLGDAAHTAHFSIGSGTKLAMDDAVSLASALVRRDGDVEAALGDYELERQPVVERTQRAASESAAYFARVAGYTHLEPIQFAFNLITRSGRITHASLAVRDPSFTRVLDAWFASSAAGGPPPALAAPPLFAPLRLGARTLPNRIAVAPGPPAADALGGVEPASASALVEAARSGAGLVLTGFVAVSLDGRITPECPTLDRRADATWKPIVAAIHEAGAAVALQLGHAGRRGATQPRMLGRDVPLRDGWPLVSASPIAYAPYAATPSELSERGMARVRAAFVAAARRAAAIGIDVLELDFAHGYLVGSFLSALSNRRTDRYGGSPDARLRFPVEVFDSVRGVWPSEGVLAVRLSVTDWARGGVSVGEGIAIARALAERGCDLVHTVAGQTIADDRPEYGRGFLTLLSDRVRTEARVATLVGGHLTTPDDVNTIVAAGRADLCVLDLVPTPLESELAREPGRDAARAPMAVGS